MEDAASLVQPHAAAIIDSLVATLRSPDSRAKLAAAKLILRWAWGAAGAKRRDTAQHETGAAGGLSHAEEQRAVVDLLLPQVRPGRTSPNPSATSCPARHALASPADGPKHPRANPAINPMSLEDDAPRPAQAAAPAADPIPPNPVINPTSREKSPSPLAAPPGTDSPRRDADPMSRALLPARHSAGSAFSRPLLTPAPAEPPWPSVSDAQWRPPRRRWRWS
jgi:hypothetical protein